MDNIVAACRQMMPPSVTGIALYWDYRAVLIFLEDCILFIKIYCTENHWYTLGYKTVPNTNLSCKFDLSPAGE
jgi:hypothetical protein